MAAITIGTDIKPLNGAIVRKGTSGAAVTKGHPVTLQSDGYWDHTDASTAQLTVGIAVQTASGSGEVIDIVRYGPVQCTSGCTPGALVYASDTAGGMDTAAGTKDLVIGYSETATVVFVQPQLDRAPAEVIAAEIGARVETLDPLAYDWPGNLRDVGVQLEAALRP